MEENTHTSQNTDRTQNAVSSEIMNGSKKKNSNGLIASTIIFALLAIGGIGFGVYGMVNMNNKSSEISDLKIQVKDQDEKIAILESEKSEMTSRIDELMASAATASDADAGNSQPAAPAQTPTTSNTKASNVILENVLKFNYSKCIGDQDPGAPEGVGISVKCPVTTTDGDGTLFWNSDSKEIGFALLPKR
ncbi:hypothetical protein IKG24_01875 [Candidatus Saccharibacteria bacterium]|nr:hypothetical protein [Candidatus Saccharibacteria bacterium]